MADIISAIENGFLTTLHTYVSVEKEQLLAKYVTSVRFELRIYAWRDDPYNKNLHFTAFLGKGQKILASNNWLLNVSADYAATCWGYLPGESQTFKVNVHGEISGNSDIDEPIVGKFDNYEHNYNNTDGPIDGLSVSGKPVLYSKGHFSSNIQMHGNWADGYAPQDFSESDILFAYPPRKTFGISDKGSDDDYSNNGSDNSNGIDIGNDSIPLTISKTYSITQAANTTQSVSWSPNGTKGTDNLTITNTCTVEHVGTGSSSPYSFTTPNIIGSSYTAWVKRYYNDYPNVQARSKTITLYTYQKPTLNSISLNKYSISARNNESLTLSLDCNNRKWTIENNFRTGIWSNHKSKYYIDYETTDKSRVLSVAEIKTLAPDTKASNGVTTATISVNRRNLGVSGGNPGNGNLVYETGVKTKEIKVYYTPQDKLNPDGDAIGYYKVERNTRGSTIQPKTTWVLPNTYDISNMTGIDVRIKYPKTDTSGVISGYKIELLLSNDGTHGTDYVWKTLYYYTEEYDYYARISYDDLKRGISGNRIKITPFYIPSNVNQGNTGSYWYGPSTTKDFVDISWMLNDPIIDCPLNGTTWHNHQYRILFKLPVDNDTNYKGTNDIEVHYGSGKYRYQEIEISINGRKTLLGNNVYMNAQNNWVSVTNVNNAKLTYLREIIINPTLIPSYSNESSYRILIRVRKAYGQNTNFDGWSNWSSAVVVNKKTVSNTNVQRHEYIMASHYMNVQNAFNNSLSCYAKKASDNSNFVVQESFGRSRGHNINGPHLSPPENTPLQTVKEYVSEFNDLHQLKTKINSYAKFDTDKNRNSVKLDYQNKLLASFIPLQEFITAAKDQNGATECDSPSTILKGRNYMKYMCDEINNLK